MQLLDHRLCGARTEQNVSTHGPLEPHYIILHNTQLDSASESIATLQSLGLGYHVIIDRDGTAHQIAPLDQIVHHAGLSNWRGKSGVNAVAIAISFVNLGPVCAVSERQQFTNKSLLQAAHYNGDERYQNMMWEQYPSVQIEIAVSICRTLVDAYPIEEIIRHDDVAIGRKIDTGPALPMAPFHALSPELAAPEASRHAALAATLKGCPVHTAPHKHAPVIAHITPEDDVWELSRPYTQDGNEWIEACWMLVSQDGTSRLGFVQTENIVPRTINI